MHVGEKLGKIPLMLYAWDQKGSAFIQKVRVNRRAKMSVMFKKYLKINDNKKILSSPQGNSIFMGQLYMARDNDK